MDPCADVISKPNCVNKSWDGCFYKYSWCNSGCTMGPYTDVTPKPVCPDCIDKSWDDLGKKFWVWFGYLGKVEADSCLYGCNWCNSGCAMGSPVDVISKPDCVGKSWDCFCKRFRCIWAGLGNIP